MSFLFINKTLRFNNFKTWTAMNKKISVFVICVEAIYIGYYIICMTVPLKCSSPDQFLGSSNSPRYHWILKLLVATWRSVIWNQNFVWLFYYFDFGRNYDFLKSKSMCFLLSKNKNVNKNETESKMENLSHSFRGINLVLQLVQELQIESKTVMSWSSRNEKEWIFCNVICSKVIFLTFGFYLNV